MEVYYELYNPLNISQKLDINYCSNNIIEIRTPIVLKNYEKDLILKTKEMGYNILNPNDSFFTDICSVFIYNDSDISLSERKVLLNLSEENFCMDGCNQTNLDIVTLRSICLCKIENENNISYFSDEKINVQKNEENNIYNMITENIDFSKASNIRVVKCFSIIFSKKLFTENYGFYIMLFMNIFNILTLIFSPLSAVEKKYKKYCSKVLNQMKEIYKHLTTNNEEVSDKNKDNDENDNNINNNNKNLNINNINNDGNDNNSNNKNENNINNQGDNIIQKMKILQSHKKKKKKKTKILPLSIVPPNSNELMSNISKNDKSDNKINKEETEIEKEEKNDKELLEKLKKGNNSDFYIYNVIKYIPHNKRKKYLSETEIENLSYKNALEIETRNKSNYYFSLLKEKNKVISMI